MTRATWWLEFRAKKITSDKVKPRLEADETEVRARVSAHSSKVGGRIVLERSTGWKQLLNTNL